MSYSISLDGKSITCLDCGMTSYNYNDVQYHYCGNCHKFHEQQPAQPQARFHIIRNTFGRWIIVNARDPYLAWSGSCWVEHEDGISRGRAHVSNFDSKEAAQQNAEEVWGRPA